MKEIQTNGIAILLVEVPEDATNFKIANYPLLETVLEYEFTNGEAPELRCINSGNWQILGKSTELSEEQMKEICEKEYFQGYFQGFCDYLSKQVNPLPVQESYLSLLEANGIVDRNNELHPSDLAPTNRWHYEQIKHKWQESQSKVKHYLVLKRI